jgi:glucokinase
MADPWLLGIEIGGTKLQLGIGRGRGDIAALKRLDVEPARGASGIREQIAAAFPALLADARLDPGEIVAAGVGFGGPVDADRGRIERSYQIEGWEDFPLADWIRQSLGIPAVVVHNDADAAGLAESRLGAGKDCSPLLYVTIGSGIGGALILDDRIYRGFGRGAGEIGHLQVPVEDGPLRSLPELEQVASGWGIARAARERASARDPSIAGSPSGTSPPKVESGQITGWAVAQAARQGDPDAMAILARARQALAFALVQALALMAPRRIVLGGGVSLMGEELWFEPIRKLVDLAVFPPFRGGFDIVPASLGEEVVVHGALALARDASTRAVS